MLDLPTINHALEIGKIYLDKGTVEPNEKNGIQFTCASRTVCCSTMNIPVSVADIDRIESHGYGLDQIIDTFTPLIINPSSERRSEPAYFLKRKPFDQTCTFLEGTQCTIHAFKPIACRIFPFTLDFISEIEVRVLIHRQVLCQSIVPASKQTSHNYQLLVEVKDQLISELNIRNDF